jgi:hypothetical protein
VFIRHLTLTLPTSFFVFVVCVQRASVSTPRARVDGRSGNFTIINNEEQLDIVLVAWLQTSLGRWRLENVNNDHVGTSSQKDLKISFIAVNSPAGRRRNDREPSGKLSALALLLADFCKYVALDLSNDRRKPEEFIFTTHQISDNNVSHTSGTAKRTPLAWQPHSECHEGMILFFPAVQNAYPLRL